MNDADKLLQTLRERQLTPLPKAYFRRRHALAWLLFLVAVGAGALAFSVILLAVQQADFNLLHHLSHSRLEFVLGLLPVFWIALLLVFLGVALYSIQYAPRSYKLTAARWVGYSAAASILLGTLFFIAGGAPRLERAFELQVEAYESMQERKIRMWSAPDTGFLSGRIVTAGPDKLILRDFSGREWTVAFDQAFVAGRVQLEAGETIKVIGEKTRDGAFAAREIRPWGGRMNR